MSAFKGIISILVAVPLLACVASSAQSHLTEFVESVEASADAQRYQYHYFICIHNECANDEVNFVGVDYAPRLATLSNNQVKSVRNHSSPQLLELATAQPVAKHEDIITAFLSHWYLGQDGTTHVVFTAISGREQTAETIGDNTIELDIERGEAVPFKWNGIQGGIYRSNAEIVRQSTTN